MPTSIHSALRPLVLAGLMLSIAIPASAGQIVIANESVPVDAVGANNLERVFLGKSTKMEGAKVGIAVLAEGATHSEFLTSFLKKNPKQFLSHWRRICFSGKGTMPTTFTTEEELVAHVAATPGAIGYVDSDTPHAGVKVLLVSK